MNTRQWITIGMAAILAGSIGGCTRETVGGAAVGAAAAGGAYEYQNKEAMDELKAQRERGEISQEEFERRKEEIESRSLVY